MAISQQLGGAVLERLTASTAESSYAAQRMARIGLIAMGLCRPVPFAPEEVPGLFSVVIGGLFAPQGRTGSPETGPRVNQKLTSVSPPPVSFAILPESKGGGAMVGRLARGAYLLILVTYDRGLCVAGGQKRPQPARRDAEAADGPHVFLSAGSRVQRAA